MTRRVEGSAGAPSPPNPLSICNREGEADPRKWPVGRDLPLDGVHVWWVRLSASPWSDQALWGILADAERQTAGHYVFPRDQRAYVFRRGLLRLLLAGYLGMPPATLRFVTGPQGKLALSPMVGQPALAFSVAQSGDMVLYALARQPVGVDVEEVTAEQDVDALAEVFFAPAERSWLAALPHDQHIAGALRLWTCKEAYVKAMGVGITAALRQTCIIRAADQGGRLRVAKQGTLDQRWSLRAFTPAPGYIAAVAYQWSDEHDFALHIHSLTDDGLRQ